MGLATPNTLRSPATMRDAIAWLAWRGRTGQAGRACRRLGGIGLGSNLLSRSPSSALSKMDNRKKGTLILTSLLEDLSVDEQNPTPVALWIPPLFSTFLGKGSDSFKLNQPKKDALCFPWPLGN